VFTAEEELKFVVHMTAFSMYTFPVTSFYLGYVLTGRNIVSATTDQALTKYMHTLSETDIFWSHATASEEVIHEFFNNLEGEIKGDVNSNIWNYDEMNLIHDPGERKVLTRQGIKYPEKICKLAHSV
jgi:hypothetical protein